jgi:hypothetical protein
MTTKTIYGTSTLYYVAPQYPADPATRYKRERDYLLLVMRMIRDNSYSGIGPNSSTKLASDAIEQIAKEGP